MIALVSKAKFPFASQTESIAESTNDDRARQSTSLASWLQHVRAVAARLDADDPLKEYRQQFHFPTTAIVPEVRYFVGNSLGLQHKDVDSYVNAELHKWRTQGREGHFLPPHPWFEIDDFLREEMASLVGAKAASEVVLMNALTVNLHLLLAAFYRPIGRRRKILCERFPFPSDMHAFISQLELHGLSASDLIEVDGVRDLQNDDDDNNGSRADEPTPLCIPTEKFLSALETYGDDIAVVVIGAVHFLTGQFFDLPAITAAAHKKGVLVGVDAAHAVGNVLLRLHEWDVDFACWGSYKYLNGGPGNVGMAFVHERHHLPLDDVQHNNAGDQHLRSNATQKATAMSPSPLGRGLKGWWGHSRAGRLSLHKTYDAAPGASALQLSSPCVMSLMMLAPSLQLMARIGMTALRAKGDRLTAFLERLLDAAPDPVSAAFTIVTPRNIRQRGSHLCLKINSGCRLGPRSTNNGCGESDAKFLESELKQRGVLVDCRPPDMIRLAPVPLYNSFADVAEFIAVLCDIQAVQILP